MTLFNPLAHASVPTHRSSFDMSTKRLFTAKVGELLPIWWTMALPGDKFKLSIDSFTRTVPVNTAAYTRIKEYFDFFCVPLRYLNSNLNNSLMQMPDYSNVAVSKNQNSKSLRSLPWTTSQYLNDFLIQLHKNDIKPSGGAFTPAYNSAGLYRSTSAAKLLDLLGYQYIVSKGVLLDNYSNDQEAFLKDYFGAFTDSNDAKDAQIVSPIGGSKSFAQNLCPLLAYQKIYYDFYSNSQWETHKAYSYNTDYWQGTGALTLTADMLELHYSNYPLDYIQGVLPNSQFGDVAFLPSTIKQMSPSYELVADVDPSVYPEGVSAIIKPNSDNVSVSATNKQIGNVPLRLNSDLSALSIRATELLQRWKEVIQFSGKDFKEQVKAQFGVSAPEYMGSHCHYIGGIDNVITINEVVNTNLTDDTHQAVIAGKGTASQSGKNLSFDAPSEHCVIMCIYHAVPICDYDVNGIAPQLLDVNIADLPQPAFDNMGMEPFKTAVITTDSIANLFNGYTVRYSPYKSDIDKVTTGFRRLGIFHSWASPVDALDLLSAYDAASMPNGTAGFSYTAFKVKPQQLNSIFMPQVSTVGGLHQDQLLVNSFLKCYKVTNLSRSGIPW